MTRRARIIMFGLAGAAVAVLLAFTYLKLPAFGTQVHPYGDRAVHASLFERQTANAISSVNFDQRALDTLGEEFIFFGSVIGGLALLRPGKEEVEEGAGESRPKMVLDSTRLLVSLLLPVTVLIGGYIVGHGHLSPGGGFQGGVILATGLHFAYLGGSYPALRKLVPTDAFDVLETIGAASFAALGVAAAGVAGAFLANFWPDGTLRDLASGGTVGVLNVAVGVEVASGFIVLLAQFFEQDLTVRSSGDGS